MNDKLFYLTKNLDDTIEKGDIRYYNEILKNVNSIKEVLEYSDEPLEDVKYAKEVLEETKNFIKKYFRNTSVVNGIEYAIYKCEKIIKEGEI